MLSALGDRLSALIRLQAVLGGGLSLLASACEPSFDPDWRPAQSLELIEAGWDVPVPAQDAGLDAGADAAHDAAVDAAAAFSEAAVTFLMPLDCIIGCTDAGPSCNRLCITACKDVPCTQGVPCLTTGFCSVACDLCMIPPIK